jgi:uncharacterized lipoprotein YajG
MKPIFVLIMLFLLAACANQPRENPTSPPLTKADIQARDEFAKSLPKPPEH